MRTASPGDPVAVGEGATIITSGFSRKVTASGVIWVDGRSYYVSRRLAGSVIPVDITDGRLVIDVTIPLRKVYRLPECSDPARTLPAGAPVTDGRPNGDA